MQISMKNAKAKYAFSLSLNHIKLSQLIYPYIFLAATAPIPINNVRNISRLPAVLNLDLIYIVPYLYIVYII